MREGSEMSVPASAIEVVAGRPTNIAVRASPRSRRRIFVVLTVTSHLQISLL